MTATEIGLAVVILVILGGVLWMMLKGGGIKKD